MTINQTLVEIETAKAAVELPSPYEGEVVELLAAVGDIVDVGAPIITIETEPGGAPVEPRRRSGRSECRRRRPQAMGGPPDRRSPPASSAARRPVGAPRSWSATARAPPPRSVARAAPRTRAARTSTVPAAPEADELGGPLGSEGTKPIRYAGLEAGRLIEAREAAVRRRVRPAHTIPSRSTGDADGSPCSPSRRCASWPRTSASTCAAVTADRSGRHDHPRRRRGCGRPGAVPLAGGVAIVDRARGAHPGQAACAR